MKLKQLLKKKKPFITYEVAGVSGCLMDDEKNFLTIEIQPPKMSAIIKSQQFTSIISRYTDVFQNIDLSQSPANVANAAAQEAQGKTIRFTDLVDLLDYARSIIQDYGKCVWHNPEEKYLVTWVEDDESEERGNDGVAEGQIYININRIGEDEVTGVINLLMGDLMPEQLPANIEIGKGGEEAETVPADKFRKVPTTLRKVSA